MPRKNTVNPSLDDIKGFLEELQSETPRAAVIIAAAFMDGWLRCLLQNVMVDDPKAVDALLGTEESDGPLSSFSSKIRAACCLGLVSKQELDDLHLIRKIRNRFAHCIQGLTFDDPKIVSWCSSLKIPSSITSASPHFPKDHRSMFLVGTALLATMIAGKTKELQEKSKVRPAELDILQLRSEPCYEQSAGVSLDIGSF